MGRSASPGQTWCQIEGAIAMAVYIQFDNLGSSYSCEFFLTLFSPCPVGILLVLFLMLTKYGLDKEIV